MSSIVAPEYMFGVSQAGMICTPNKIYNGSSFVATLPNKALPGETYTICVEFKSKNCIHIAAENFTGKQPAH